MNRPFELDVHDLTMRLLNIAREKNVKPAVMVAAMADIIGQAGAMLERADGIAFDERTNVFIERAKASYNLTREKMAQVVAVQAAR